MQTLGFVLCPSDCSAETSRPSAGQFWGPRSTVPAQTLCGTTKSGHMIAANATATIELHGAKQKNAVHVRGRPGRLLTPTSLALLRVFSGQERTESRAGAEERCRSRKVRCLWRNAQNGPGLRVVALIAPGKPRVDPMTASTSSHRPAQPARMRSQVRQQTGARGVFTTPSHSSSCKKLLVAWLAVRGTTRTPNRKGSFRLHYAFSWSIDPGFGSACAVFFRDVQALHRT